MSTAQLNLPALNKGYFWRITYGGLGISWIQLRQKFGPISLNLSQMPIECRDRQNKPLNPTLSSEKAGELAAWSAHQEFKHKNIFAGGMSSHQHIK